MKSTTRILIAFLLNLAFSLFELIGGSLTGSVAIASDALHDFGDALSTGIAYILERKSAKQPDDKYTFGYARYSILGALITTAILMAGSVIIIHSSIERLIHPEPVNYDGMMILAIVGVIVSAIAAFVTHESRPGKHPHNHGGHAHSADHHHNINVNQKAVSLHMFEDVFGWLIVLVGSILMHFTDISIIDPIISMIVAILIFISAIGNLGTILNLFLEKAPANLNGEELQRELKTLPGVLEVHHLHLWSLDGKRNFATLHAKVEKLEDSEEIKQAIKQSLRAHGVSHVTVEIESKTCECCDKVCYNK